MRIPPLLTRPRPGAGRGGDDHHGHPPRGGTQPVAGLDHLGDGVLGHARGGLLEDRLVDLRVEGFALLAVRSEPEPLDRGAQLGRDGREAAALRQVAVLLGALQIVEHRDETLHGVPDRALALDLPVGLGALAVVRVLRGHPLEVGEPLGGEGVGRGLAGEDVEVVIRQDARLLLFDRTDVHQLLVLEVVLGVLRFPNLAGLRVDPPLVADDRLFAFGLVARSAAVLVAHGYFFSSSSTTSASMTSSSSEDDADSPPASPASPAGASEACADE